MDIDQYYQTIIQDGLKVIQIEQDAIERLKTRIDDNFCRAVEMIHHAKSRVYFTGIGKSGIICKKICATMTSIGYPAIFLHPVEGLHGDLGLVFSDDIIIAISKSGETVEVNRLIPLFRRYGCKIISMTGNKQSHLARSSDIHLDISVREEACPFDLVPTSSTTAALVMGDALAIALLKQSSFNLEDFARNHPGGSIGRSLLKVKDLMKSGENLPIVSETATMQQVLREMTSRKLGMTCVVDSGNKLVGVITDGDLRRCLLQNSQIDQLQAGSFMTKNPKTIEPDLSAGEAVDKMEHMAITSLIITDSTDHPIGVIHLHDLIKSGVVYRGKGHLE